MPRGVYERTNFKMTPARLEANQRNAALSTGPRTTAGMAASSLNATKHGLLSSRRLVEGESQEEFDSLAQAMVEQLSPELPMEVLLVDEIVGLVWRLRRLERVEVALFASGLTGPVRRALEQANEQGGLGLAFSAEAASFSTLSRYEATLANRMRRALGELERLQGRGHAAS